MKRLILALALAGAALLVVSGSAFARGGDHGRGNRVRHVSTSGSDTGDCTNAPCRTIGYAVTQAQPGDVVAVGRGTYSESVLVQKRLTLSGGRATVDATGQPNGIVVDGPAAAGTDVRGFSVENAVFEGILAQNTSHVRISHNVLEHNDTGFDANPSPCQGSLDDCGEALHLAAVTRSSVTDNVVRDNVGGILLTDDVGAPGAPPTYGPTTRNLISGNRVLDNTKDCGITLASHFFRIGSPAAPNEAGVYRNVVAYNVSNGAGAAGIGVFAGPPGGAAWGNLVLGNSAAHNGLPGVAIHSHTPFQNVNGNAVVGNRLADNGGDDGVDGPTGIDVLSDLGSGAAPIDGTVIASNSIAHEHYGIYTAGATNLRGLPSNRFEDVAVPFAIH